MDLQLHYNHLVIPLSVSIILIISLIILGKRQHQNPVTGSFLFFMVCLLIWMSTSLLGVITYNLQVSLLAANVSFIGITFFPVAWLSVVMNYSGKRQQFRNLLPFLVIIPILTNIIIWTNPLHHLWRKHPYLDVTTTWFPITVYDYGPWYSVVHLTFSLGLAFIATFLLLRSFLIRQKVYRNQIFILLIAVNLPLGVEILHQLGFDPIPYFNSSTLVFPISGLLVGFVVLRYRFLDLTPIARELLVESIQDMMIVLDNQGRIVDLNSAARQNLFQGDKTIIGKSIQDLPIHQSKLIGQATQNGHTHQEIELPYNSLHKNYEVRISPIKHYAEGNAGLLLLLHDITERKIAEQALYEQIQQVAALEERQRLARDLHDSVNQTLFAAKMMADLLMRAVEKKPEKVLEYALNIQQLLQGTTAEMRMVLMELYPDALVQTDLGTIINKLCDAFTGSTGILVDFSSPPQVYLEKETHIAFYRIAQEALHNINKHALATEVLVKLSQCDDQIEMTIQDNGSGFDMTNTPHDHFGLKNMTRRATDVGATIEIISKIDHGTTILVNGKTS